MVSLRERKKRDASPSDDVEPSQPPPKKRQARGKKAAVDHVDDDSASDAKPAPKKRASKAAATDSKGAASKAAANKKNKASGSKADTSINIDDEDANEDAPAAFRQNSKYEKGKTQLNGQHAKANNLIIPVDDYCSLTSHHVFVDGGDNGIIYDASLNQTNSGANNNKFYRIQLLTNGQSYYTWTRWGRVGDRGQSALLGDGDLDEAMVLFDKKFKDKTGLTWANRGDAPKSKKYVFIEKSYEPDSSEDEDDDEDERSRPAGHKADRSRSTSPAKCTLAPPVKSLMELIFNQEYVDSTMAEMNYDASKLPLGKLSKATITRGYQALKDLAALIDDPTLAESQYGTTLAEATESLSNLYFSYIPHDFGRRTPPVIRGQELLRREVQLLESLTELKDADAILKADKGGASSVHPLDSRFNNLGLQETTPVDRNSDEFTNIQEYLVNTRSASHGHDYSVLDVFRIERQGETGRFEKRFGKVAKDRRLLWHGSRSTNYGGILSQGLRIAPPEAPASGYMFGKGIYLADMSSKSANYCCAAVSGGHALLLLCEAELGTPMQTLTNASYTAGDDALSKGLHSTWGQGMTGPKGWKDAACIHPTLKGVKMPDTTTMPGPTNVANAYLLHNEYICYDVSQVRLRYLLRVKM